MTYRTYPPPPPGELFPLRKRDLHFQLAQRFRAVAVLTALGAIGRGKIRAGQPHPGGSRTFVAFLTAGTAAAAEFQFAPLRKRGIVRQQDLVTPFQVSTRQKKATGFV